ncbi:MAG TPA: M28 family peptidase [Bacteroidales bacterium]|nr:M28 family peptidase [Bacteroidales bacterium]
MKHHFRQFLLVVALWLIALQNPAQDRAYVHQVVRELASPAMHGRGYYRDGDHKAAAYIRKELHKTGLEPLWENYQQLYTFTINSFPGKATLKAGSRKLRPGRDFVINPASGPVDARFKLLWLPDTLTKAASVYALVDTNNLAGIMPVLPKKLGEAYRSGMRGIPALMQIDDNIWWHVSRSQWPAGKTTLKVHPDAIKHHTASISIKAEAKLLENRPAYNVGAMLRGHIQPDSFIVFVAHYDHLGRMGHQAVFPGASDNASGTAAVLDLARYYGQHPDKAYYSMVFLLVSGEEAGLLGSRYFVENPPFELSKTRFVINFDMVGTGSQGLNVFNAKANPQAFEHLAALNNQYQWFGELRDRGASCNSDHCPFHQKGIPAFFLLTYGPENRHYHNIYDKAELLPFTRYEQLFGLVTTFIESLPHRAWQKPLTE